LGGVIRAFGGDLETIAAKALEKDKTRRYASAAELAADLRRFLSNEPILAMPATAMYRARKFILRHRVLVSAAAVIFIVLLAGIISSTSQAIRAKHERDRFTRGTNSQSGK
jgi:eukaryotic-like serine/threonine-protein kinase